MEATGSAKQTRGSSTYTVTSVSVKPDGIPLMYGFALMCWGPGTILNSRVDNGSP